MITNEQRHAYLKDPNHCPRCNSPDISTDGLPEIDGPDAAQDMTCDKCQFAWSDLYKFVDIYWDENQ